MVKAKFHPKTQATASSLSRCHHTELGQPQGPKGGSGWGDEGGLSPSGGAGGAEWGEDLNPSSLPGRGLAGPSPPIPTRPYRVIVQSPAALARAALGWGLEDPLRGGIWGAHPQQGDGAGGRERCPQPPPLRAQGRDTPTSTTTPPRSTSILPLQAPGYPPPAPPSPREEPGVRLPLAPLPLPRGPEASPRAGSSSSHPRKKTRLPQKAAKPPRPQGLRGARPAMPALPGAVTASARRRRPCLPLLCSRVPSPPPGFPPPAPFTRPGRPRSPAAGAPFPRRPAASWAGRLEGAAGGRGPALFAFIYCCVSWPSRAA